MLRYFFLINEDVYFYGHLESSVIRFIQYVFYCIWYVKVNVFQVFFRFH